MSLADSTTVIQILYVTFWFIKLGKYNYLDLWCWLRFNLLSLDW
jgi:hypothetical protein